MKLLILGGTRFVGRHMTEAALEAGHEVTLFNRNRQGTDLGVETLVETLVGDRLHDVSALTGRTWDAVIDVSAYTPAAAQRRGVAGDRGALHLHLHHLGLQEFCRAWPRRTGSGRRSLG